MYDVVIADPPWSYYKSNHTHDVTNHYNTMTREDLLAFPWKEYVGNTLFMWATSPKLDEALDLGRSIGLHYRGVAFVWVKTAKNGKPLGAMGVRPSIVKPTTEFVLSFCQKPKGRPLPLADESVCQTVFAPLGRHSEKPDEVQVRLERMYPDASRCELFARRERAGWDCFGLELGMKLEDF